MSFFFITALLEYVGSLSVLKHVAAMGSFSSSFDTPTRCRQNLGLRASKPRGGGL
eukprot:CAMPEP_0119492820 /NCGR_PEP_ID=MMETSP1344-20130328/17257_1 /TAXON_ID=236787 /ORGANISM="Florenciella parvula, Strain CCMP2471" /LENGTH=54 /DNA_ID=CAMNT_0007528191 /DNA_START=72 /DNA_END=233 /DNA_ORIENTATION=+